MADDNCKQEHCSHSKEMISSTYMFKRKLIFKRPFSLVFFCFYLVVPTSSPGLKVQIPIPKSTLNATEAEIYIKSINQAAVPTTVANVKKICRLDELKDICCCARTYGWHGGPELRAIPTMYALPCPTC